MYVFVATYENMDTLKDGIKIITLEEQKGTTERDYYFRALGIAYDTKNNNECLASLEFVSC